LFINPSAATNRRLHHEETIMDIADKVSDFAHEAGDRIADATETLGKKGEQMMNAEERMMKNCRHCVRDRPIGSLLVAAAAGFLLGRLSS
jgi:ElaB/YqjD/DUF883 family membrane-anchored ribosome-binding protein